MQLRSRPLIPFFLLSCGLHLIFFLGWPRRHQERELSPPPIPVALVPALSENKNALQEEGRKPRLRPSAQPVKRTAATARVTEPKPEDSITKPPVFLEKEMIQEAVLLEERPIVRPSLPNLKELLPPVTWSRRTDRSEDGDLTIPLNSREPRYVSYLTSVKRAIEVVWEYPEAALRRGIEGKLVLEFTISSSGGLSEAALVQSSGSRLLDEEAIRAVRAASPFHPIPPSIGKNRLHILASFEYTDNRLKYGAAP